MRIESSLEVAIEDQIRLFNDSFAGYLAGFSPMDSKRFGKLLRSGGIDLSRSLIALDSVGKPAGLAYANVYAGITRLAVMGVAPAFRRKGCAQALLKEFVRQAVVRKSHRMTLEVFEQNVPAVELYRKNGFTTSQRLFGYRWNGQSVGGLVQIQSANLADMLVCLKRKSILDQPYQFSLFGMLAEDGGMQILRHKTAWIAYSVTTDGKILLKYLADEQDDPELQKELVWAVAGQHSQACWTVPQIVPEHLGRAVLEPLGFERLQLNQIQMFLELS